MDSKSYRKSNSAVVTDFIQTRVEGHVQYKSEQPNWIKLCIAELVLRMKHW